MLFEAFKASAMVVIGMCEDHGIEFSDFLLVEIGNQAFGGEIFVCKSAGIDQNVLVFFPYQCGKSLVDVDHMEGKMLEGVG